MNRGGLTYLQFYFLPSKLCTAFSTLVFQATENFFNLKNQKAVLLDLNSNFWKFCDCLQINNMCPTPTYYKEKSDILKICVNIFSNILLNNYSKGKNDKITYAAAFATKASEF